MPKFVQLVVIRTSKTFLLLIGLVPALVADSLGLADVKKSNPIEVAEYAVVQGIDHEPAFAWWVPHTLKKRNRMIASVNMQYHKTTHKLGLRVPNNVAECEAIDKENWNTLWMDAVTKEMEAVRIAFKIIGEDEPLPGYQEIPCHLIFTIKIEDFRRKARYIAGGHRDKISTSLVECERVKAKIGKALRADGSPCVWKKFPPARGQKGFLS